MKMKTLLGVALALAAASPCLAAAIAITLRGIPVEAQLSRAMKLELDEINGDPSCGDVLRNAIPLGQRRDYSDDGDNGIYYEFHTEWTCAEPTYTDPKYKDVMTYVEYQLDGELRVLNGGKPAWDKKNFVITKLGIRTSADSRRGI